MYNAWGFTLYIAATPTPALEDKESITCIYGRKEQERITLNAKWHLSIRYLIILIIPSLYIAVFAPQVGRSLYPAFNTQRILCFPGWGDGNPSLHFMWGL